MSVESVLVGPVPPCPRGLCGQIPQPYGIFSSRALRKMGGVLVN